MTKFKKGDVVVCINDIDTYGKLVKGETYVIERQNELFSGDIEYSLEGNSNSWLECRFEPFDEWAKHQVKCDCETELELTKIQVKALQSSVADLQSSKVALQESLKEARSILWTVFETIEEVETMCKVVKYLTKE